MTEIAMTMEQLKAHAYDVLAQIESLQKELQATNAAIDAKFRKESAPVAEEVPEVEAEKVEE